MPAHRIEVCQRGHDLTGDNVYIDPRGDRNCRACRLIAKRKFNATRRKGVPTPIERIRARSVVKESGCWQWVGAASQGYGRVHRKQAHRLSYEAFVGPIPEGLDIDHLCGNTLCVNPAHLEPVTHQENVRRAFARRRGAA